MRKLIVSMNVTIDGFMSGPNCELDWHFQCWTSEMADSLHQQLSKADTILLGSITYRAMEKFWPQKAKDPLYPREDLAFADMMNHYKKLVFSATMKKTGWYNSSLLDGHPCDEVRKLKNQPGKDIIIYGSGKIVNALSGSGLIDEYQLWVHPVLLGKGKPFFKTMDERLALTLDKVQNFESGVILLFYNTKLAN